jgi:hypothetical protein
LEIDKQRGKVLLKTIHGSKLYGTNHSGSDEDWYYVTEHGKARHKKVTTATGQELDVVVIGLSTFNKELEKGTHQALEALFSTQSTYAPGWRTMFDQMTVYSSKVDDTYRRTIRNLSTSDDTKLRRHAVRMTFSLISLRDFGRFDPTLTKLELQVCNTLSSELSPQALKAALTSFLDNSKFKS